MPFYLSTAIDYVNSRPHLGTAYEKITADVIARYKRLCGINTHFLMGNDEHSQNVFKRARALGLEPAAYCDRMEQEFRSVWAALDISFDDFIRTTEPRHRTAVERLTQVCFDAGDIYEGEYNGWFCVSCEAFKQERDLANGRCPVHPTLTPEWLRERNYFFRLSKYQEPLLRHFEAHEGFLQPAVRRNEMLRLIESGLDDISVSRAGQAWGIPLPFSRDNAVYVWFDALVNYIAAIGYGADDERFAAWWPATLHVVGKDITRFHTVVWPAMLMSAGLALPESVFGHGWINFGGQRMSKSAGTSLDPVDVAARFGPDPLRLYLTKEIAYGADGDFTWERYEERYNTDLANNLGNLVSRVSAMAHKYRKGRLVPAGAGGRLSEIAGSALTEYRDGMERYALHEGAAAAYRLVDAANEFIASSAPWALAKNPASAGQLDAVLFEVVEAIRVASVLLLPIMPTSAAEILRRVGESRQATELRLDADGAWKNTGERIVVKGAAMWPRAEASVVPTGDIKESRVEVKPQDAPFVPAPEAPPAAQAPAVQPAAAEASRITFDEFMNVELRVAKVLTAEAVPKSRKLLKLTVDAGAEERTILAGIAGAYEPEELVGRRVVIVFNLKPAKLMGIESDGMVLAASPENGPPSLLAVDESIAAGTRVR
jgi:methionyl-tRNA synthetase